MTPLIVYAIILLMVVAYCFLVAGTFPPQDDGAYPQTYEDINAQLDRMGPTRQRYYQNGGTWMVLETFKTPDGDCFVRTRSL